MLIKKVNKSNKNQILQKYIKRLAILKENRANTVDKNTDAENEQYDILIKYVAGFIKDLKQLKK